MYALLITCSLPSPDLLYGKVANEKELKKYNLPGALPPQLVKLPHLQVVDFAYNYLSGTIPREWASMQLTSITLLVNRLSGEIPKELGNITTLTYLSLEANQISGIIPPDLGKLINLQTLMLSSNRFTGNLPVSFSGLINLTDFRINDNNFSGTIPIFIQNWKKLERLTLRSCNISGEIPAYLWTMKSLELLKATMTYRIVYVLTTTAKNGRFFINKLGIIVTVSACTGVITHAAVINSNCLHVNSGGKDITINENKTTLSYEGDGQIEGGAAKYFVNDQSFWGFSSTGDFMDDNDYQNTRYTVSLQSSTIPELYQTARISPISLTYFHYCLQNGNYTVNLHFAEIQYTNDHTYNSLGRRVFDIYVQERLVSKDFNIEDEVGSAEKPLVKQVLNVNVTNNMLEIRFYFAGKGTTRIPDRGVYGPIISAICPSLYFL
ncbi:hypothetical protein D5086_021592, partial [Populus alba]